MYTRTALRYQRTAWYRRSCNPTTSHCRDTRSLPTPTPATNRDAHVAAGQGDVPAAIHHETGRVWSYRQLAEESSRLAAGLLSLGLRPGERVAYRMPHRPEAVVAALAVWKAGNARADFHP